MCSSAVNLHRLQNCTVSVKVYFGQSASNYEIRRFIFKSETPSYSGIYESLLDRIRALYHGLNLKDLHLCWKDDDGDYVVFSSDDELKVAINSVTDNTLRIYIREKELPFRAPDSNAISVNKYSKKKTLTTNHNNRVLSKSKERATCSSTINHNQSQVTKISQPIKTQGQHHQHQPLYFNKDVNQEESLYQTPPGTSTDMASMGNATSVVPESSDCTPAALCCNQCHGEGRGVWYKCTVCQDFLLCSDCENRGLHDHHIMVRLTITNNNTNSHNNDLLNSRLYTYPYHYKR